ncbi:MAG TPA: hypothetical protein VN495_03815 [Candidatus Paceibacterota bacterium]|nr:hypothetical protein [Candidatus Paceibacterota bacterium]
MPNISSARVTALGPKALRVNLRSLPRAPFLGARALTPRAYGSVLVVNRRGQLYVDGGKVSLHFDTKQLRDKTISGTDLAVALVDKQTLHPNILDALLAHPHMIPEAFKTDAEGRPIFLYFWGCVFESASHQPCVRYVYWDGLSWRPFHRWLSDQWGARDAALIFEY